MRRRLCASVQQGPQRSKRTHQDTQLSARFQALALEERREVGAVLQLRNGLRILPWHSSCVRISRAGRQLGARCCSVSCLLLRAGLCCRRRSRKPLLNGGNSPQRLALLIQLAVYCDQQYHDDASQQHLQASRRLRRPAERHFKQRCNSSPYCYNSSPYGCINDEASTSAETEGEGGLATPCNDVVLPHVAETP